MHSMTAFAAHEIDTSMGKLSCEIKSVNQRFLDLTIKCPDFLRASEQGIRKSFNQRLSRGKITVFIRFYPNPDTSLTALSVNQALITQLVQCASDIAAGTDQKNDMTVRALMLWPDVISQQPADTSTLNSAASQLINETIDELIQCRAREGEAMKSVLSDKADTVEKLTQDIRQHVPEINQQLRGKLLTRLSDVNIEHNPERLEQELAIQLQKIDITEELDRLDAHIIELKRVLNLSEPVGRRLDFLVQELNRESNTIGSKSVSNTTSNASIELKVAIEQMREQIQNIE